MTHAGSGPSGIAINMFWHGPTLSRVERLSMVSFLANGHNVRLHVYDEPSGVPAGVELVDAGAVLPESSVFRYPNGSVAGFANWFRYRLLHEQGGIWSDTDVVCLKPFDFPQPEVFAWGHEAGQRGRTGSAQGGSVGRMDGEVVQVTEPDPAVRPERDHPPQAQEAPSRRERSRQHPVE